MSASDLCRKHGISNATLYKWRSRYGGMEISEARNCIRNGAAALACDFIDAACEREERRDVFG
jgi:transposase-like protein